MIKKLIRNCSAKSLKLKLKFKRGLIMRNACSEARKSNAINNAIFKLNKSLIISP